MRTEDNHDEDLINGYDKIRLNCRHNHSLSETLSVGQSLAIKALQHCKSELEARSIPLPRPGVSFDVHTRVSSWGQ